MPNPDLHGYLEYVDNPENLPDWIRHADGLTPPTQSPHGTPARCYHIQVDYIPPMLAVIDYLVWEDVFTGTPEQKQLAASRMVELQILLMKGNQECGGLLDMEFRQNPDNVCQLQFSNNGGDTWELMFDYSLCFAEQIGNPPPSVTVVNQINMQQTQVLYNYGTGGLPAIAPDMIHDSTPKDDFRDMAACAGVYQILVFIRSLAINKPKHHQGWVWDWWRLLDDLANLALDVLFWVGDLIIPDWTIMDELIVATGKRIQKEIGNFLSGYDITPLQDEAVISRLLCYAYATIDGATVTYNEFSHMFDGSASVEGMTGSAEDFLVKLVMDEDYFAEFMAAVNDWVDNLESGLINYDCPCDEWEYIADMTLTNEGFTTFVHDNLWSDPNPPARGIYHAPPDPDPGWWTEFLSGSAYHLTLHKAPGATFQVTYLKAEFVQTGGGKSSYQSMIYTGNAEFGTIAAQTLNSGATVLEASFLPRTATCVGFDTSFNSGGSQTVLKKLTVRGIGVNPF